MLFQYNGHQDRPTQPPSLPQVLTSEHMYSRSIGVVGNRPGEFLGPTDLTIDSLGNVIITDTRNHRIQVPQNTLTRGVVEKWLSVAMMALFIDIKCVIQ